MYFNLIIKMDTSGIKVRFVLLPFIFGFIICGRDAIGASPDRAYKLDSLRRQLPCSEDTVCSRIYISMAKMFNREFRQYDSALKYAKKVIYSVGSKTGDAIRGERRAVAFGEMAIACHETGKLDSALFYDRNALEYWRDHDNKAKEVDAASRMVYHYAALGNFKKAYDIIVEYDRKLEQLTDTQVIANYHNTIGAVMRSLSDTTAIDRLWKAYDLFKKIKDPLASNSLINIGGWYQTVGMDFEKAYHAYRQFLAEIPKDDSVKIALYSISMGILFADQRKGNPDSAIYYLKKGLDMALTRNMSTEASHATYILSVVNLRKGNYAGALKYCNESIAQAQVSGEIIRVYRALNILDDIYLNLGQTTKAYQTLKRYTVLSDSLRLEQQEKTIKNLEMKRRIAESEQQKIILDGEVKIRKQRNLTGGITISSLLLIGGLLVIHTLRLERKRKLLFLKVRELAALHELHLTDQHDDSEGWSGPAGDPESEKPETPGRNTLHNDTSAFISHMLRVWVHEKGFMEHVTIHDVAMRMKTNTKYLSEVICREYAVTSFNEFINKQRINYLLGLLESEPVYRSFKVESLAGHLGFGSKTTFIRAFKDFTGLTPNFYLEQLREQKALPSAIAG